VTRCDQLITPFLQTIYGCSAVHLRGCQSDRRLRQSIADQKHLIRRVMEFSKQQPQPNDHFSGEVDACSTFGGPVGPSPEEAMASRDSRRWLNFSITDEQNANG